VAVHIEFFAHVINIFLAGNSFNHPSEQTIAKVAVDILFTRLVFEYPLGIIESGLNQLGVAQFVGVLKHWVLACLNSVPQANCVVQTVLYSNVFAEGVLREIKFVEQVEYLLVLSEFAPSH
jgi:hypothetical protein